LIVPLSVATCPSLTPLQPSERLPFPWEEALQSLNELLKKLTAGIEDYGAPWSGCTIGLPQQ
jgi:hypothetical protein